MTTFTAKLAIWLLATLVTIVNGGTSFLTVADKNAITSTSTVAETIEKTPEIDRESDASDGWAKWSAWSACSKTCGRGIQHQLRRCMDVHCSGASSRYRICELFKKCDETTRTDAQEECALRSPSKKFRRSVGGEDDWQPITTTDSCTLSCASRSTGELRHFANVSLKNGAKCRLSDADDAACLHAVCQPVGCDGIIGSTLRVDACGRCGGDGRDCTRRAFQWRDTLQFTPCEPTCGANRVRVSVSVCVNTVAKRVVPERLCADQPRPRPQVQSCAHVVCPAKWLTESWSKCSASCGGSGIQTRDVYCVEAHATEHEVDATQSSPRRRANKTDNSRSSNNTENWKVPDRYCWKLRKPPKTRKCGSDKCPKWRAGKWSTCSATCGNGFRKRTVECRADDRRVTEARCSSSAGTRPFDTQPCSASTACAQPPLSAGLISITGTTVATFIDSRWTLSRDNKLGSAPTHSATFAATLDEDTADRKPRFSVGPWSACSATCGSGVRTRTVTCTALQGLTADSIRLPDHECDGQDKPELFQSCQLAACRPAANISTATALSDPTLHLAELMTGAVDEVAIPDEHFPPQPSGRRLALSGNTSFRWEYGEWTPCSASCLGGNQKSTLKCMDMEKHVKIDDFHCEANQRPVEMTRACNRQACLPEWEIGEFSTCSHSCGGGVRSRRVRCTRIVSRSGGAESTLILPEAQCSVPRPISDEPCGLVDCPPSWQLGRWSDCSTSCGAGEQRRDVTCERRDAFGVVHVFADELRCASPDSNAEAAVSVLPLRPSTVRLCNLGPCPGDNDSGRPMRAGSRRHIASTSDENRTAAKHGRNINTAMENSEEINTDEEAVEEESNHRKLTLDVGGFANLYEGTSVKVKCPVKNFSKDKIFWTKDGRRIFNNAHMKVSTNGALRIFHARVEDAGVFACFADGARGNVTLTFKSAVDMKSTENLREKFDGPRINELVNVRFTSDQLQKVKASLLRLGERRILERLERVENPLAGPASRVRLDFAAGEWSHCSQLDCAQPDGAQVRMLRCRLYVAHLTAYIDDEICTQFGVTRPPATRPCADARCPRWDVGEWSDCSVSRCLRAKTALQKRVVKCIYGNGTKANYDLCDRRTRPKVKKECMNLNCTAEWRTSPWGKCSKPCGDGGVQMRLLRCVWHGTRKPAGRRCNTSTRPIAIRMCDVRALKHAKCTSADEEEENRTAKFWKARAGGVPTRTATSNGVLTSNSSTNQLLISTKSAPQIVTNTPFVSPTSTRPAPQIVSTNSQSVNVILQQQLSSPISQSIENVSIMQFDKSDPLTTSIPITTEEVLDYAEWKSRQLALATSTSAPPSVGGPFLPPFKGWERWRGWRLYNWPAPSDVAALKRLHS